MSKYRDRLHEAAMTLLQANGITGRIRGDMVFLQTVDVIIEEITARKGYTEDAEPRNKFAT